MSPYARPDWESLLRAVAAAPDDDLPRLVAADWLDENGDADRAAFVRTQCDRARHDTPGLAATERQFLTNPFLLSCWAVEACPGWVKFAYGSAHGSSLRAFAVPETARVTFHCGFPRRVCGPAADWLVHGNAILPRQPIQEVTLTRCDDLDWSDWWNVVPSLLYVRDVTVVGARPTLLTWLRDHLPGVTVNGGNESRQTGTVAPAGGVKAPSLPHAIAPTAPPPAEAIPRK